MFLLYFLYESWKNILHFLLQNKKLRDFRIGIFTYDILELRPLHFLTFLMKKSTFTFSWEPLLTDKGRFSAVGVDANHNTAIAVDTIWTVLDGFAHMK